MTKNRKKKIRITAIVLASVLSITSLPVSAAELSDSLMEESEFLDELSMEEEYVVDTLEAQIQRTQDEIRAAEIEAMEETVDNLQDIPVAFSDIQTATADGWATFSGELCSETDETAYQVEIDFTTMDTAAFCLVRTGYVGVRVIIYNEDGTKVNSMAVTAREAKEWCFLDKPDDTATVCTYTMVVTPYAYSNDECNYRLMVGEKADTEEMMSGLENAVLLDLYCDADINHETSMYTPNQYEYWFKYTKGIYNTITIMLRDNNVRFKIVDAQTMGVVYESIKYQNKVHKTRFIGPSGAWTCAEKVDSPEGTNGGSSYYLVVYNTRKDPTLNLNEKKFVVAVGHPLMGAGTARITPQKKITMSSSAFTSLSYAFTDSSIPTTAQVDRITFGGVTLSNVYQWRAQAPNKSSYRSSTTTMIDMGYRKDYTANAKLWGTWNFWFKANTSAKTKSFTPYFSVTYYYEYGD